MIVVVIIMIVIIMMMLIMIILRPDRTAYNSVVHAYARVGRTEDPY